LILESEAAVFSPYSITFRICSASRCPALPTWILAIRPAFSA
jgi:hypothetical protein